MVVSCPDPQPRVWVPSVGWMIMRRARPEPSTSGLGQKPAFGGQSRQQDGTAQQAGRVVAGWSQVGQQIAYGGLTKQNLILSSGAITMSTLETAKLLGAKWASAAIPVVGPAVAGVTTALSFLFARKGPRQKRAVTEIVDKIEPLLKENLQGYFSQPVRTYAMQQQALANFDAGWQYVVEHCLIPEMGNPGKACVEDRKEGACKWKAHCVRRIGDVCIEYGPEDPSGECWNWFKAYRDPIANDPEVQPDPEPVGIVGSIENLLGGSSPSGSSLLIGVLLLAGGLLLLGSGSSSAK